jgi:hypothetical protein
MRLLGIIIGPHVDAYGYSVLAIGRSSGFQQLHPCFEGIRRDLLLVHIQSGFHGFVPQESLSHGVVAPCSFDGSRASPTSARVQSFPCVTFFSAFGTRSQGTHLRDPLTWGMMTRLMTLCRSTGVPFLLSKPSLQSCPISE